MKHRFLAGIFAIAFWFASPPVLSNAQTNDTVRLALNPGSYAYLPIFLAIDKGYFADQHLNLTVTKYSGSALSQLPSLARGDLDIAPMVLGPGLFNQATQGFALKMIASIDQSHAGWHDTACILVRQDVWTSGAIRNIADLRGKKVDGGMDGSPQNYLLKQAILKGGLSQNDMTYTEKFKTVPDIYAALHNKAADVVINAEPVCTQLESEGLAHRWLSFHDAVPNMQASFITTSSTFIKDHRDVVKRFLMALLRAESDIKRGNGSWSPELIATVSKWSEIPTAIVSAIPGPPYTGQYGAIDLQGIATQQQFWMTEGSVKQHVEPADLIDSTVLAEARRELRLR